jgi:hypothetical protein
MIILDSVQFLLKKNNQTKIFFLKKPKPVQTSRCRFGFLGQKPVKGQKLV